MTKIEEGRRLCVLMENNMLSLLAAIQDAHGPVNQNISQRTVSEFLTILALNNIELKCTYLGDVNG